MQTHEPVIDIALSDDNSVLRFIQIRRAVWRYLRKMKALVDGKDSAACQA